jgi:Sulfotransferase family
MEVAASLGDALYRLHQAAWSAWARRRYREDFERVARFCLFVGYPRSGHSVVGALLNAHRNAVISHELNAPDLILAGCSRDVLYSRILARAYWFDLRGNTSNYSYQVPGQWQGRFEDLRVIGDKRGGAVTRSIAAHDDFLARVRALVGIPLRLIHVVRNPFDNISAISSWHQLSLEDSVEFYFQHCRTTSTLGDRCGTDELITLRHEEVIREPQRVLSRLCDFLGLEPAPEFLEDCARVVFPSPTYSRRKIVWPPAIVRDVERRAREHADLAAYRFEVAEESCRPLPPA